MGGGGGETHVGHIADQCSEAAAIVRLQNPPRARQDLQGEEEEEGGGGSIMADHWAMVCVCVCVCVCDLCPCESRNRRILGNIHRQCSHHKLVLLRDG